MDMKIISAFLLSAAISTAPKAMAMESPTSPSPISTPTQSGAASQPIDLTVAADKALNSVVYIKVSATAPKENVQYFNPFEDFFGDFFGQSTPRPTDAVYHNNANVFDKQPRRVKEIRVFYDDGTFEVFAPASK